MPVRPLFGAALAALVAAGSVAAPALAQDRGRWDWGAGPPGDPASYELRGRGVDLLVPELRDTRRGHIFVLRNFDSDHNGFISPPEADAANRAFLRGVGAERARFDWDRFDRERIAPPPPPPPAAQPGWDRGAMRDYHFRQNRYGAVFNLQDVLFETGSAVLRPGAQDKLMPLARYLRANPRVQVRIDGFTDSVGTAASNLTLSRDRARSVGHALAEMGVDAGRLQLAGHGESSPVASNGDAAGRQLNRRVEVTLVGQRAASFG